MPGIGLPTDRRHFHLPYSIPFPKLFVTLQQSDVAVDLVLAADLAVAGHDDLDIQLLLYRAMMQYALVQNREE